MHVISSFYKIDNMTNPIQLSNKMRVISVTYNTNLNNSALVKFSDGLAIMKEQA